MELISVVLSLKPAETHSGWKNESQWWGQAAQAILLKTINGLDAELAVRLHGGSGLRPYTTSSLMGSFPDNQLDPQGSYSLRFTGLTAAVSEILLRAATEGAFSTGKTLVLDPYPFNVASVFCSKAGHVDAGRSTYGALAGEEKQLSGKFQFELVSPVIFHTQKKTQPLPLPELVFGSLFEKWNAFAPKALMMPAEVKTYAETMLAISRFDLESRAAQMKSGGLRVGAVGRVQFSALNSDRYWLGMLHTLAGFARFAGVGAGTTQGLGQVNEIIKF